MEGWCELILQVLILSPIASVLFLVWESDEIVFAKGRLKAE